MASLRYKGLLQQGAGTDPGGAQTNGLSKDGPILSQARSRSKGNLFRFFKSQWSISGRPLLASRATASRLNSSVN
jgi:hypothetical protein